MTPQDAREKPEDKSFLCGQGGAPSENPSWGEIQKKPPFRTFLLRFWGRPRPPLFFNQQAPSAARPTATADQPGCAPRS